MEEDVNTIFDPMIEQSYYELMFVAVNCRYRKIVIAALRVSATSPRVKLISSEEARSFAQRYKMMKYRDSCLDSRAWIFLRIVDRWK